MGFAAKLELVVKGFFCRPKPHTFVHVLGLERNVFGWLDGTNSNEWVYGSRA